MMIRYDQGAAVIALTLALLACSRKSPGPDTKSESPVITPAAIQSANAPVEYKEKGVAMSGFVQDIESLAVKNDEFRRVVYTAKHCQLVVMAL